MSDQSNNAGGFGGSLLERPQLRAADLNLIGRAVRKGWGIKPELRQKILDRVELIVDNELDDDLFLKASRIAIEADKLDAKREENVIQEKHYEILEATAVMRAAMEANDIRDHLAKLSDKICKPISETDQTEIDEALKDESEKTLHSIGKMNGTNGKHEHP